jgi:Recombination endonuclease VII
MERLRQYRRAHPHRESPESSKIRSRKSRITAYGFTEATFAQLLEIQENACAMCHEPLEEGQRRHIDHDHACCLGKRVSCGKCVRGVLCHVCNIALGHIERRQALARVYLANPPGDLLRAALGAGS